MARYNLQLIGDGKDFTEEQVLAFIECHPDDFNPQEKSACARVCVSHCVAYFISTENDSSDESGTESSDSSKASKSSMWLGFLIFSFIH